MQKSIRTLAVAAILSFVAAPSLMANRMGCNPHPQVVVVPAVSTIQVVQYSVLAYFGL